MTSVFWRHLQIYDWYKARSRISSHPHEVHELKNETVTCLYHVVQAITTTGGEFVLYIVYDRYPFCFLN